MGGGIKSERVAGSNRNAWRDHPGICNNGTSNTEITYKIGSRAAWLLGKDEGDRATIFDEMKHLYKARSDAVHSGVLPSKSKVDLDVADQLVVRVVQAILERGKFPDWASLTLGGQG